jgi:hypothetical protein
MYDNQV